MPAIEIISPGLATSLQARPFRGTRHRGMPLAGAADAVSLALANWLAGNDAQCPAIETAFAPFSFRADAAMTIGISGAARQAQVNGAAVSCSSNIHLRSGDTLSVSPPLAGCRSYIAVHGGFVAQEFLNGNSTYPPAGIGGSASQNLPAGTMLEAALPNPAAATKRDLPADMQMRFGDQFILRFLAGPEYDLLSEKARGSLTSHVWRIGNRASRMGIELEGAALDTADKGRMESSAVFPGSVQCPPSGSPFLLGPDAQTTGGYPRIAHICRADRHVIGQLRPGTKLSLVKIETAEARRLYRSKIIMLRKLQPDIQLD